MNKIKYVQLEPDAFLSDLDFQLMTAAERGVYVTIILYMYRNGGKVENSPEKLKRLCNCGDEFEKLWETVQKKFQQKNGCIRHKRVRHELSRAEKFIQRQRNAGLASAAKRQPPTNHGSTTVQPPFQPSKVKISKVKISKEREDGTNKILHQEYVLLTAGEYQKLLDLYGQNPTKDLICRLNNYIGSTGRKYKSHYFTIRGWAKTDNIPVIKPTKPEPPKKPAEPIKLVTEQEMADIKKKAGRMFNKIPFVPHSGAPLQNEKQKQIKALGEKK